MLTHHFPVERNPSRVVILGSAGFIGGEILHNLQECKINCLGISRTQLNLSEVDASKKLEKILSPDDVLVFVSAKVPCKNLEMLLENIQMAQSVIKAIRAKPVAHIVYISSDAVYKDSDKPLSEDSCAQPDSFHGIMHLAREVSLKKVYEGALAIVRPTLIYGKRDPHNGYGPNQFHRLIANNQKIILFGEGEELRDHVDVRDVAELVRKIILFRSTGIANAVSGEITSFKELAQFTARAFAKPDSMINETIRSNSMPHNGYRAFDNKFIQKAFPDFKFTPWKDGLKNLFFEMYPEIKL